MANIVAITGRPNVGKSTLFNRLVGERRAIMDDMSGVTRDRHYGMAEWGGKKFTVIDTGGYVEGSDDIFEEAIRRQVVEAVNECTVVLFMVDCRTGITPLDEEFAEILRRSKKKVIVVANKADTHEVGSMSSEFYSLGFEELYPVSSQTGSGSGDLLDKVLEYFSEEEPSENSLPKVAILGRPNAGKSSLLNSLLGNERSIVTDVAGTTRDAIHTVYNSFGYEFILTDTAGIRKKAKVKEDIEFYSVLRALRALEDSDVCIVMLDATLGLESQDMNILSLAHQNRKGLVVVVNKWDLVDKQSNTAKEMEEAIRKKTAPIDYYPVIFASATEKQRVFKIVEKTMEVYENKTKRISTSKLNDLILEDIKAHPPATFRGRMINIKYATQLPTKNPTFAFFCNIPEGVMESYSRYLENRLREHFNFEGVPIRVVFRKK